MENHFNFYPHAPDGAPSLLKEQWGGSVAVGSSEGLRQNGSSLLH